MKQGFVWHSIGGKCLYGIALAMSVMHRFQAQESPVRCQVFLKEHHVWNIHALLVCYTGIDFSRWGSSRTEHSWLL